jgi:Arc/MetJ-type ribon-helix-helix transcriptional regulator/DNA-directed RNA polymerase subunit RPC12/RpoP
VGNDVKRVRIELEIPTDFYREFSNLIKGHYANRSEAIRDAMRLLMDGLKEMPLSQNEYYAIPGKKKRTKAGVFVCPNCGVEHWSISFGEEGAKCNTCGKIMVTKHEDVDKLLVEKEVDAYECPKCGTLVEDNPLNYTGEKTIDGQMAVMCPECHNFVNGLPLIHHGTSFGNFEPKISGTDYFFVYHRPCQRKGKGGFSDIYACIIDAEGRIILNVQCQNCKAIDAIKTSPFRKLPSLKHIFLSSELRERVGSYAR